MIWWTAAAYACQSTYGCYQEPRSVTGSEAGPGDAVVLDTPRYCWDFITLLGPAGEEVAAEEIVTSDIDVLAVRVPADLPPGPWTLRVATSFSHIADIPLTVVAPREASAGALGAVSVTSARSTSGDGMTWGCDSSDGWFADVEVALDGRQGPSWLVQLDPLGTGDRHGAWLAVPEGATSVAAGVATQEMALPELGCVRVTLYDPQLRTFAVADDACTPIPPLEGDPDAVGDTDPPTAPADTAADPPDPKGCASAAGPRWLALLALALLRRSRAAPA